MIKNPTPRQLILVTTSIISLFTFLILLFYFFIKGKVDVFELIALPVILFVFSYLLFSYSLERFIYRKIKVIYKYISSYKYPGKEEEQIKIRLQDDVINHVTQEVSDWADSKSQEIAQLKKMEKFRREYIGNVSHELKTPIFNIQGYLETLIDTGVKDKKTQKKFLNKALKNANRLGLIIEDLEMISRNESGNLQLHYQDFCINKLITEVIESFDIQTKEKNVDLKFKDPNQKNFHVSADRERIRQVLTNLISNAIKYSYINSEVLISCYDMDEKVLIEVTDHGIGIDEKHLNRLYERFYRVDKDRSRNKGGTGLGLSIVKHIIEAHNQSINIRSSVGVGSTFGFTLKKIEKPLISITGNTFMSL